MLIDCYFLFNYLVFLVLPFRHYLLLVVNLVVSSGDLSAVRGLGGEWGGGGGPMRGKSFKGGVL